MPVRREREMSYDSGDDKNCVSLRVWSLSKVFHDFFLYEKRDFLIFTISLESF